MFSTDEEDCVGDKATDLVGGDLEEESGCQKKSKRGLSFLSFYNYRWCRNAFVS